MDRVLIDALISCPKRIKVPPKKQMTMDPRNNFTFRNDFTCVSQDEKTFEVFLRNNTKFPFLFSIGLRYKSEHGTFIICRYNGKHPHRNKIADHTSFDDFHVHKLYDIQLSDDTTAMLDADATDKYITFEEALYAFLNDCNIQNWREFFPDLEEQVNQYRLEGV